LLEKEQRTTNDQQRIMEKTVSYQYPLFFIPIDLGNNKFDLFSNYNCSNVQP
jgi:hypothetical protein